MMGSERSMTTNALYIRIDMIVDWEGVMKVTSYRQIHVHAG